LASELRIQANCTGRGNKRHTRALDEEIQKKETTLVGVEWRGEAEVKVRGKLTLLIKMQAV